MGRPQIIPFSSLTDTVAIDATISILKTEKNTTVSNIVERFRKRVKVEANDETLFVARVKAAISNLVSANRVTLNGENVSVVAGKRGRPKKVVASSANA